MNNAPIDPKSRKKFDTAKTELSSAESREGAKSRKMAFAVLVTIALVACGLAVVSWYQWVITAKVCVETYFQGQTPKLLTGDFDSLQERFTALDISSFSALILAVFFTRLAYVGCRNLWLWARRDGKSYFDHAHHTVLFTEQFDTLCIRLGLLGTLLSFLLAALTQMSDQPLQPAAAAPSSQLSAEVAAVLDEDGVTASPDETTSNQQNLATSDLSGQMFLLLCASLVSTFVGTGVAYALSPALNWLNDRAVGRHQLGEDDAELVAEEFFRQIARTSERLSEFQTTTMKLAEAANNISRFEANVAKASDNLVVLLQSLDQAIQTFQVSNHNGQEVAAKLNSLEAHNDLLQKALERFPERLNAPLESISRTSQRFKEAAHSGEVAFRELKSAAGTAHDSLEETKQRSKMSWKMLHEVRESLKDLANSERHQTEEVANLASAFQEIGQSIAAVVGQLQRLKTNSDTAQAKRPWWKR